MTPSELTRTELSDNWKCAITALGAALVGIGGVELGIFTTLMVMGGIIWCSQIFLAGCEQIAAAIREPTDD